MVPAGTVIRESKNLGLVSVWFWSRPKLWLADERYISCTHWKHVGPEHIYQCMKWPVAHSPNSTWFWLELVGNCCERLKIIMECTNIQLCERLGHGWQFHPLYMGLNTSIWDQTLYQCASIWPSTIRCWAICRYSAHFNLRYNSFQSSFSC